jgi:hypothetical protein
VTSGGNARGYGHDLAADLMRLQERLEQAAGTADRTLGDAVSARPLLAVGAAAGLGFLLGGGLPRAAVTVLLGVGVRLAGAWLQQELFESPDTQEEPS